MRNGRRQAVRGVMTAMGLLAVGALTACASMGERETERVDGRRTKFVTNGNGAPTVVFEADIGEKFDDWRPIFREVAAQTRAFAYTRPGYDADNPLFDEGGMRTGEDVARHLRQTLREAGVEPPYILVGHAMGGLYSLNFAKLYPNDVAGMVLVDGRPATFTETCRQLQLKKCDARARSAAFPSATTSVELRGVSTTERLTPRGDELGAIPVTLVVATKAERGVSHAYQAAWTREQRRFHDLLANGRYVEAVGTAGEIHKEDPFLVIREIRQQVENARASSTYVIAPAP